MQNDAIPADLQNMLSIICPLAVKAGEAVMRIYETDFAVGYKDDKSPLTLADTTANEMITKTLRGAFPACAILAEESKDDKARLQKDFCFIVDPLDGTKEFINRNGQFTVNIALAYRHKSVLGVIYVPAERKLYYAYENGGAFFEDIRRGLKQRIHVTGKLDSLTVVGSKSHASPREAELYEKNTDKIAKMISAGSSLKGCMVASGEADIYYRFGLTSEWDIAAMQCIVEEAGGIFLQTDGTPMRYNREDILNRLGFFAVNRAENIWI